MQHAVNVADGHGGPTGSEVLCGRVPSTGLWYATVDHGIGALLGDTGGPDAGSWRDQAEGRLNLRLSMALMPDWARHLTNTWHPSWFQRLAGDTLMRTQSGLVRWAYPEPPCVQLARDRALGGASVRSDAA